MYLNRHVDRICCIDIFPEIRLSTIGPSRSELSKHNTSRPSTAPYGRNIFLLSLQADRKPWNRPGNAGIQKTEGINGRSTMRIQTSRLTICDLSTTDWMGMKRIFLDLIVPHMLFTTGRCR